MNEKIRFKDLSIPLKIAIIFTYLFLIGNILDAIGWI